MCDRILLFSTNPGRIIREIEVDLHAAAQPPRSALPRSGRANLCGDDRARADAAGDRRAPERSPASASTRSCRAFPPTCCPVCSKRWPAQPYNGKADLPGHRRRTAPGSRRAVPGRRRACRCCTSPRSKAATSGSPTLGKQFVEAGDRRPQEDLPAPAPGLCPARRAHPPRAAGAREPRGAEEPLLRRAGRPHEHRRRRGDAALGHRLGPLCRSLRLRRRFADFQSGKSDVVFTQRAGDGFVFRGGFAAPTRRRRARIASDSSARSAMVSASAGVRREASAASARSAMAARKPRRVPLPQRRLDQILAPEVHRRLQRIDRESPAGFDRRAPFVQLRELALRGEEDRADGAAGGARLGKLRLELGRAAGERRVNEFVERQRRSVGDDGGHLVDADRAAAGGVEDELAQLAARSGAVAAEQRNEQRARVRRERQAGGAHLAVDEARPDRARYRHSRAAPRRSWRARTARAAARCGAGRRPRSPRGIRCRAARAVPRPRARCCGCRPCTHTARRPPNSGMVCASSTSRAGLGGDVLAVEPHQRERIGRIVDRRGDDGVDALADEAGVGAEDQHDRRRPVEARQKASMSEVLSATMAGGVQVPATKYEASLFLMPSATTLVARSSASRCARCLANRCSRPGMS